ncbi:TPA: type I toxin-antitoxin system Ibs family toxin [Citrobacter freundii]|nr:type I toxin-antitoxin system Ibs family toxin [Citrobacter freundii]EKQ7210215.1 type I toxin-antitoxin system Ibs family toxin [Citrobacter freundii]EKV1031474.1 type I toxin-antitoxin system Ibs family toxin [Citrobacter freundii]EKW5566839.1 type I toxin-antitoxin system Ibs family toxin [Citrobacter freundii]EKX6739387.1 type I toxin-antitoxin system Ibs family toxin [Citrobacter freundii]
MMKYVIIPVILLVISLPAY